MRKLKSLILYKEIHKSAVYGELPSIRDNLGFLSDAEAEKIAEYLKNGIRLIDFVSPVPSPLNNKVLVDYVIYSDGEYRWDGILVHLVETYKVRLPAEFVLHVNKQTIYANERKDLNREELIAALKEPLDPSLMVKLD